MDQDEKYVIRSEFNEFKESVNDKLDKIFDKLRPQFTQPQITAFLISLVTVMAGVMIYITDIKSDTRNNSTRIRTSEKQLERMEKKIDKLIDMQINTTNGTR